MSIIYKLNVEYESRQNNRLENQDYIYADIRRNLFIVADGMQGLNGKNASKKLVESLVMNLPRKFNESDIESALEEINDDFYQVFLSEKFSKKEEKGLGTTADVVWFDNDIFHVFHYGDGRVYGLYKNDGGMKTLERITQDHRKGSEYVEKGMLGEDDLIVNRLNETSQYHNKSLEVVTRAIGLATIEDQGYIDVYSLPAENYNGIMMVTDGISDFVLDDEIEEIMNEKLSLKERTSKILDSVYLNKSLVDLCMRKNSVMLADISSEMTADLKLQYECLINDVGAAKYLDDKGVVVQQYCKEVPELNDYFREKIKQKIGERDNASIINIELGEPRNVFFRFR